MFILLVKVVVFVMHLFLPLLSVFVHGLMLALFAVSLRNQSTPDMSDPDNPSPGLPWYMTKGCSYATPSNKGFCMQARASFGVYNGPQDIEALVRGVERVTRIFG